MMRQEPKSPTPPLERDLKELSLKELEEIAEAIDRELEARAFADSLEAQVRMFMRRREG